MTQNDVVCANIYCPMSSICGRFNQIPNGELHKYKIYRPVTNENGETVCDYFTIIEKQNESDREIHSSSNN